MIIIGTNDIHPHAKLLSETYLTLEIAIKVDQTVEVTRRQVELLQREPKKVNSAKSDPPQKKQKNKIATSQ